MALRMNPLALVLLVALSQGPALAQARSGASPPTAAPVPAAGVTAPAAPDKSTATSLEALAAKDYRRAADELKAAAMRTERAGSWAGGELKAGTAAAAADVRLVGEKLEGGTAWTRAEVAKAFDRAADAINAHGKHLGGGDKASPFDVGA